MQKIPKGFAEWLAVQETERQLKERDECTRELKRAWGSEYSENINRVRAVVAYFLKGLSPKRQAAFMDATLPDGRRLFNDPDVVKFFARRARELEPVPPDQVDKEIRRIQRALRRKA